MRSAIALSVAALAGSVIAAPSNYGGPVVENVHWVYKTVIHTAYEVEGSQPTPAPAPAPEAPQYGAPQYGAPAVPSPEPEKPEPAPVVPSPVYVAPAPPASPTPAPAAPSAPAQAPSAPSAPSSGSGSDAGYIAVVETWRKKLGLKELTKDGLLESNALKCVTEGNGQMVHKLFDGTYGQVLAEGEANAFENVYVGGWLCEMPETPGLGEATCADWKKGWSYNGQKGHAKILHDASYSKIGCAWFKGIWGCDLA